MVNEPLHLFYPIDVDDYFSHEIDERIIRENFNFSLISNLLREMDLFKEYEIQHLTALQTRFTEKNLFPLDISKIEKLHAILINGPGIESGIRTTMVGITGTNYKPLEYEQLIRKALREMCSLVNQYPSGFQESNAPVL